MSDTSMFISWIKPLFPLICRFMNSLLLCVSILCLYFHLAIEGIHAYVLANRQSRDDSDSHFIVYVDSRKSTSGYIVMFAGGALSWRSEKQTLIPTSTMKVEFVSCFEATSHGVWMKSFIYGLRIVDSIPRLLKIFCDNLAAVFLAKNN